ncbi:cell wall hydrolase [Sphingomonas parva]|uniref:Cell wall hydrolase n=1 Tax=Sphingomonas parva TaxID=2555898 RepID=A0A4Y8ZY87_9SPHN|nr:cell wall hydrolase [Sphingomonas parva]TFI59526.1 cell wall hydrolase [Sphingomonas parva]
MIRIKHAAGISAAVVVAAFGTLYAGPSRAWEFTTPPVSSSDPTLHQGIAVNNSLPQDAAPAPQADAVPETVVPAAPAIAAPIAPAPQAKAAAVRRSLAQLVADHSTARTNSAEHECLANAVYFETRGEPLVGQLSVAEVVVNRARSGRFPSSVCGVVKQKGQFSFVRGGRLPAVPRSSPAWRKAVAIARIALEDLADGHAPRALFFHAKKVRPSWRGLRRVAAVGNHVFYR